MGHIEVEDHALELLMTYTTFHIGLYMSLTAALIAAQAFGSIHHWTIRWAVFCFVIAGACGGLIAVNVAEFDVTKNHIADFFNPDSGYRLAFWNFVFLKYRWLAYVEHGAFWIGILPLAVTFIRFGGDELKPGDGTPKRTLLDGLSRFFKSRKSPQPAPAPAPAVIAAEHPNVPSINDRQSG